MHWRSKILRSLKLCAITVALVFMLSITGKLLVSSLTWIHRWIRYSAGYIRRKDHLKDTYSNILEADNICAKIIN